MATLTLNANTRKITGRKVRRLREQGIVPIVIYGRGRDPENAQVDSKEFERVLSEGATSQLVQVDLDGEERNILVRDIQRHPVRHFLLHADFYAVNMREKQQVPVPLVGVGVPAGADVEVVLVQALDSVEISALPADIPASIVVDVTGLEGPESDPVTVADLPELPGVEYLTDPSEPIFSLVISRAAFEEEEDELEGELMEGDVEPEVIGRGKDDEDEEFDE